MLNEESQINEGTAATPGGLDEESRDYLANIAGKREHLLGRIAHIELDISAKEKEIRKAK